MRCWNCKKDLTGDPFLNLMGQNMCPNCGSLNDIVSVLTDYDSTELDDQDRGMLDEEDF